LNGKRYEWEEGDFVVLPILPSGVEYQHFNSAPNNSVLLIADQSNLFDALGVDLGSGFEQLENAPEYESKNE
jgi:gentisate 1,2-dioxygenase